MPGKGENKFYKNPGRQQGDPNTGHYTPQYQKMGITPTVVGNNSAAGAVMVIRGNQNNDNPRLRKPGLRQEYAEVPGNALNGQVPNVGNSMEHSWSGVDDEIIDDVSLNQDFPMVDNNEVVDTESLQLNSQAVDRSYMTVEDLENLQDTSNSLDTILAVEEGKYILLVGDVTVLIGTLKEVQETASSLVFGEHELCQGNQVPIDNIVVLKKVGIKVGLFLE